MRRIAPVRDFQRFVWTLQRFGLTPGKVMHRLSLRRGPRVLVISIPKSGTHLLERALCLHPHLSRKVLPTIHSENVASYKGIDAVLKRCGPNQILITHLPHTPQAETAVATAGFRTLFMLRDPRDVLVSRVFHICRNQGHPLHARYCEVDTLRDRLLLDIEGDGCPDVPPLRDRLNWFAGWLDADALLVRFEDLIGARGHGCSSSQIALLSRIFDHVGVPLEGRQFDSICARLHDAVSPTFRKGTIGQWQEHFDAQVHDSFNAHVGDIVTRFGYASPS